jgi:hypothetical protein
MRLIKQTIIAGALALASINYASAAVVHIEESGILIGAKGVVIGGSLYDVSFDDGTLDAASITAFTTSQGAQDASDALLKQVFLGVWDTIPQLTRGCESAVNACRITTPYEAGVFISTSIEVSVFSNNVTESSDNIFLSRTATGSSSSVLNGGNNSIDGTLARWTLTGPVAAIPEPETYAMMFAGLGILGFVSRRRKQKSAV